MKNLYSELKGNRLVQTGAISLLIYCSITYLSKDFVYGANYLDRPIILFISLYFILFFLYFFAVYGIQANRFINTSTASKLKGRDKNLVIILFFAFLFRLALLPSNPVQEDDFYRYIWDGKAMKNGINPYKYSPGEINDFAEDIERDEYRQNEIKELELLNLIRFENSRSMTLFNRINHPDVPTIYPPASQIIFLITEILFGGKIIGLRIILLVFDLSIIYLILRLLSLLNINPLFSVIYAWSPLVIKETVNSMHIEPIALLFLIYSIFLFKTNRFISSAFIYTLSILSKYYSLIILPVFVIGLYRIRMSKLFPAAIIMLFCLFIFYLPFSLNGWFVSDGLIIYGNRWERNDSIFALIKYFTGNHHLTLFIVSFLLLIIVGAIAYKRGNIIKIILTALAAFFLLSPTQYPWYFIPILPFISLYPNRALILLSGLLSFYYLEFYFIYNEAADLFYLVKWIEFLPFYILLIYDMLKKCEQ